MDKLAIFLVIIMTPIFFLVALSNYNDSAAEREYARAAIIREQSQARSDLLAGALPYVGLVAVIVVGGLVVITTAAIVLRLEAGRTAGEPGQLKIIERYYVVLPEGAGRKAMWNRLTEAKLIEGGAVWKDQA